MSKLKVYNPPNKDPNRPKADAKLISRLRKYEKEAEDQSKPWYGEWGSLHIVMADGNIDDNSIEFCVEFADERGDKEGSELGGILFQMTMTQRRKLYRST